MAFNDPEQNPTFERLRRLLSKDLEVQLPGGLVSSSDNDDRGRSEDPSKMNKNKELSNYELSISATQSAPENKTLPRSFRLGSVEKLPDMALNRILCLNS